MARVCALCWLDGVLMTAGSTADASVPHRIDGALDCWGKWRIHAHLCSDIYPS